MTAMELAELFGTTVGAVNAGIKAIIKSDTLHDYEVCKYVRLENGTVSKQPAINILMT